MKKHCIDVLKLVVAGLLICCILGAVPEVISPRVRVLMYDMAVVKKALSRPEWVKEYNRKNKIPFQNGPRPRFIDDVRLTPKEYEQVYAPLPRTFADDENTPRTFAD